MADPPAFEFLKRRYASAIERADDRTATRLRAAIDRLLDDPPGARVIAIRVAGASSAGSTGPDRAQPARDHDDILGPHL